MDEADADEGEKSDSAATGTDQSRRRARASAELGQRFAELLSEDHSHPYGVCAKIGLSYSTYKLWMRADIDADDCSEGVRDFQCEVLRALDAARVRDIKSIEDELDDLEGARVAISSSLLNKHMFHHDKRFKRFYAVDDEAKRSEIDIGNKDGKPFAQRVSGIITEQSRRVIVTEFLGLTPELLDVGAKAGETDMSTPLDESVEGDT